MIEVLYVDASAPGHRRMADTLRAPEFDVAAAPTAEAALYEHAQRDVDVVITTVELQGMDGIELCRVLKARSSVPVIVAMPTSHHDTIVTAFDAGADDVVAADRQHHELPARIHALWRRCRGPLVRRRPLRLGAVVLQWGAGGHLEPTLGPVALSPDEATVLGALAERIGCVVPFEVLRRRLVGCHGAQAAALLPTTLERLHDRLLELAPPAAVHRVADDACVLIG